MNINFTVFLPQELLDFLSAKAKGISPADAAALENVSRQTELLLAKAQAVSVKPPA